MSEAAERTTGPAPDGYHGLPALKPSPWSAKVPAYVALVGAGGAAQILAALARWGAGPGSRSIVRNGRLIALGTAIAGAPLLIADLKTPQRFLNMLRIWRPTSPMSFGSFTLTGFGAASALAVAGDLVRGRRGRLSRAARTAGEVAQAPAALLGAGVATYTGALLSATSVPLWQSAPGLLTARFAASAFASGAAALSIAEHAMGDRHGNSRRLGAIALAATAVGLVLARACDRALRRDAVDGPLRSTPEGALYSAGAKVIGQMLPIALLGTNAVVRTPSRSTSIAAAAAIIAGSFALRHAVMKAEKRSATSAADYLRLTASEAGDARAAVAGARRGPTATIEGAARRSNHDP